MNGTEGVVLAPHSIEAEQAVLGCCLLGGAETVGEVLGEFGAGIDYEGCDQGSNESPFYDLRHAVIFGAMARLVRDGKPVELVLVGGMLQATGRLEEVGGYGYLTGLPDVAPSALSAGYYAELVREKWELRRMLRVLGAGARRIMGEKDYVEGGEGRSGARGTERAGELLDEIEAEVLAVNLKRSKAGAEPVKASVLRLMERLENYQRGVGMLSGIRTHFGYFDKMTGGLHAKEMIVVAARPGCGKTSFAMNVVEQVAIAEQQAVLVFTMEMSADDLSLRMLCGRSGADFQRVRTGFASERDFELIAAVMPEVASAPIYFDETPALEIEELRGRARRVAAQHGVKLIVIDYLQLGRAAGARRRNDNRAIEVGAISSGCKAMAKELELPVLVLSQLNRESDGSGRCPQLSDLRESGSIEQDADLVAFLWKPKLGEEEEERVERTGRVPVTLTIGKQRNGPTGNCELSFEKARMRFEDRWGNTGRRGEGEG